jgi:hypothetical protein
MTALTLAAALRQGPGTRLFDGVATRLADSRARREFDRAYASCDPRVQQEIDAARFRASR